MNENGKIQGQDKPELKCMLKSVILRRWHMTVTLVDLWNLEERVLNTAFSDIQSKGLHVLGWAWK